MYFNNIIRKKIYISMALYNSFQLCKKYAYSSFVKLLLITYIGKSVFANKISPIYWYQVFSEVKHTSFMSKLG